MYHFKEFAKKINLVDQLMGYNIAVRGDRILIDGIDYRLDVYGWPDNRIVFSDKLTGQNTIKRYGYNSAEKCRKFYYECLELIGVDLTALDM